MLSEKIRNNLNPEYKYVSVNSVYSINSPLRIALNTGNWFFKC